MAQSNAFELYALNHNVHPHCTACWGCVLDPNIPLLEKAARFAITPIWCVGCMARINNNASGWTDKRPWDGGLVLAEASK